LCRWSFYSVGAKPRWRRPRSAPRRAFGATSKTVQLFLPRQIRCGASKVSRPVVIMRHKHRLRFVVSELQGLEEASEHRASRDSMPVQDPSICALRVRYPICRRDDIARKSLLDVLRPDRRWTRSAKLCPEKAHDDLVTQQENRKGLHRCRPLRDLVAGACTTLIRKPVSEASRRRLSIHVR